MSGPVDSLDPPSRPRRRSRSSELEERPAHGPNRSFCALQEPEQVGQLAVGLGVSRDNEDTIRGQAHAARYSLIPAKTSRLWILLPADGGGSVPQASGGERAIPLWGRCEL